MGYVVDEISPQGIEALTVSLINAYLNGAHERRVAELAAKILPGVPVSLSRFSATYLSAPQPAAGCVYGSIRASDFFMTVSPGRRISGRMCQ